MVSNVQSLTKKKNNKSDKSYIPEIFSDKITPAIDFTDDPAVQCECNIPVVRNTFVDDGNIQVI